jgi:hypothetical protein
MFPWKPGSLVPEPMDAVPPKMNRARPVSLGGLDNNRTPIGLEFLIFEGH